MKLIEHVLKIRGLIQQAVENSFARFGAPENIIATHQVAMEGDYNKARLETVKECVFTLFNRLAALKVMEDRELFPEVIRRRAEHGNLSYSHKMWLEEHPDMRSAERMGLKDFLSDKFQQLFEEYGIPLYKAAHPYAVMPTADELDEIITAFNDIEQDEQCGSDIWKGDDILGWMYENFNTVEKVQLKESGEKIEYDKVFLQSQIYTPQWVVKFLVDNTLGKQYLEMYPDSRFMIDEETGKTKYLIANAPKHQVRHPKPNGILDIKLIDPACGSGNFLIYAFTVFYDMYVDQMENYGADFSRRDIPKLIVENNLYGVDLDERAVQITQIALFIKAMQLKGRRGKMPTYCNVVSSHFSLPDYETIEATFKMGDTHWDEKQREMLKDIWNDLCNAHKFGSLLRLKEKIEAMMPEQERSLFNDEQIHDFFSFKNQAIEMLRKQVQLWGGEGSNAYSLSLVNDAMTFLDILTTSFDVAVANPPYTDSSDFGPELKEFAEANYKKPMKFNINLYACFIKRCCELTDNLGKVGMIHPMTFMYIKTFEDVRKFILNQTHINLFVEYGLSNLFGSVMVDPAFYVLEKDKSEKNDSLFISLDQYTRTPQEKFKKQYCLEALSDIVAGNENKHVYLLPQDKLKAIKSWPFIYWISDEFREKFGNLLLDDVAKIKQGIATTNNNRFCRLWWEIEGSSQKYYPYSKGGAYNKWAGNLWLYINWEETSVSYISKRGRLQNKDYYFKEGITYSGSGSKGTSFREFPKDCLFDVGGSCIFPTEKYNNRFYLLAFLNTSLCFYIADCLNPTVNTQVGDMQRVPFVIPSTQMDTVVTNLAKCNIAIKKVINSYSLVEKSYTHSPIGTSSMPTEELSHFFNYENALLTQNLINEAIINRIVFDVYELSEHDRQMVLDKEGVPVGDLTVSQAALDEYKQWLQENQ